MNGIRAIHCLCYYLQLADKKDAILECSIFQGVLVKMAQSVSNSATSLCEDKLIFFALDWFA